MNQILLNMSTKVLHFFFVLLLSIGGVHAQDFKGCPDLIDRTQPKPSWEQLNTFRSQKANQRLEATVYTLPVQLHFAVSKTGGMQDLNLLKNQFVELNAKFAPSGIQFVLCTDIHYIYETRYDTLKNLLEHISIANRYNNPSTVDIFFVSAISGASGFYSNFSSSEGVVFMLNNISKSDVLIHELGHYFGLPHTHDTYNGREKVDGSNCKIAGDLFCDTPADPDLTANMTSDCKYIGTVKDPNGQDYKPDVNNYMSYAWSSCLNKFSTEQYNFIAYTYQDKYSKYNYVCANKPDFSARIDYFLNKLNKGQNNKLPIVIQNFSSFPYTTSSLKYKISLKDVFDNVTVLSNGIVPNAVKPSSADTAFFNVFVPNTLADGAYTLVVEVDPDNAITETLENNNVVTQRVAIFLNSKALPDLDITAEGAEYTYAGYEYLTKTKLKNIGNYDTEKQASYRTYVSKDDNYNQGDFIDGPSYYTNMTPGQEYVSDARYSTTALLTEEIGKTFYVFKVVDQEDDILESNENNNVARIKVTTMAAPPHLSKPDYLPNEFDFTSATTSLQRTMRRSLKGYIKNIGDTTNYLISLAVYYSKDNIWDNSDVLTNQSLQRIFFSSNYQVNIQATVPSNAPLGSGYFLIVVDNLKQLIEKNENNNSMAIPITVTEDTEPFLSITSMNLNAITLYYNDTLKIATTIKNTGLSATSSQLVSLYFSKDPVVDFTRIIGKNITSSGWDYLSLKSQASRNYSLSSKIVDTKLNPGSYYVSICATSSTDISSNINCFTYPDKVVVGHKPSGLSDENVHFPNVEVYPNPANDLVTIRTSKEISNIEIVDQIGQPASWTAKQKSDTTQIEILLNQMPKGIYFLKISTGNDVLTKKLVVK